MRIREWCDGGPCRYRREEFTTAQAWTRYAVLGLTYSADKACGATSRWRWRESSAQEKCDDVLPHVTCRGYVWPEKGLGSTVVLHRVAWCGLGNGSRYGSTGGRPEMLPLHAQPPVAGGPTSKSCRRQRRAVCSNPMEKTSGEYSIRLSVEALPEGQYLATSEDLPGLVAQGRTVAETMEIARDVARKLIDSYSEHGDSLPDGLRPIAGRVDLDMAVGG